MALFPTSKAGVGGDGSLLWDPDHPVLEILRSRRACGSEPNRRTDKYKVGLAVEGGGMRGIISAAMLTTLEDFGFAQCFDDVYACSGGAINAAYFLEGNSWYPLTIYLDDLSSPKFIRRLRFLSKSPVMDLTYAFEVIDKSKPLNYERVLESPVRLHVGVSLVDKMTDAVYAEFSSASDLREALIASSWLPLASHGTRDFRGQRALDGGVLSPFPFHWAVQDGCTHVLSLSTRPMEASLKKESIINGLTVLQLNRRSAGLGQKFLEMLEKKRVDLSELRSARLSGVLGDYPDTYVLDLAPLPHSREISRHEIDRGVLLDGARDGYTAMYCALEREPPSRVQAGEIAAVPRLLIAERRPGDEVRAVPWEEPAGNRDGLVI